MASERFRRDRRHRDRRAPVRRASLGLDAKGRQELVVWQASSNQSLREVAINFISGLGKKGRLHQRSVRRGLRIDQFRCEVAEVPSNAGAARTSSTLGKPLRHLRSSAFAGSGQHTPSPLRSSSASAEERGKGKPINRRNISAQRACNRSGCVIPASLLIRPNKPMQLRRRRN